MKNMMGQQLLGRKGIILIQAFFPALSVAFEAALPIYGGNAFFHRKTHFVTCIN